MNNETEKPRSEQKGVSRKTLDSLREHASRMRWYSMKDKTLKDIVIHSAEMLPGFDRESWQELRNLVLFLEENEKIKGRVIPQQELSIDPPTKRIRFGNQYRPSVPIKFVPIFNPFAQRMINLMFRNLYSEIPKMSSKQKLIVQDNLDILRTTTGWEPASRW